MSASAEDLAKILNPEQLRAATTTEGPLLILAGAGSGKTRVLVHRAAHILETGRARPYQLFAVTFTNKAAGEMRERLAKLIGPEVKEAWIGTFHALCARMLRFEGHRLGYSPSFTIYDSDDSKRLLKKLMDEKGFDASHMITPQLVANEIDKAKNEGIGPKAFADKATPFDPPARKAARGLYFRYANALRRSNAMDFGDLLMLALELLRHHPEARQRFARRFRYVMVDEFQDTNKVQYDLLEQLVSEHKNLAVVGDDDQSIYRWRGAEVENILGFHHRYPNAAVVKLEQNYRSTSNILTAANQVIRRNKTRHDKTLRTDAAPGARVGLALVDHSIDEAALVSRLIKERIEDGEDPEGYAILYRQNAQSRLFEEALRRERVPYVLIGGTGFYDRKEVKDVLAYLRVTANPASRQDFERIINVPSRKIGDTTLQRLRAASDDSGAEGAHLLDASDAQLAAVGLKKGAIQKLRELAKLLADLRELAQTESAAEVARQVITKTRYEDWLESSDPASAEDRIGNVAELVTSIAEHEMSLEPFGQEEDRGLGIAGAKTPLAAFLDTAALTSPDDAASTEGRVSLLTLHSAKGLEFPVVFMVGMEEGTFPSKRVIEENDERMLEEERRLCYVGMTRAMKELHLLAARIRLIYGRSEPRRPSRFLGELPEAVVGNVPLPSRGLPSRGRVATSPSYGPASRATDDFSDAFEDELVADPFEGSDFSAVGARTPLRGAPAPRPSPSGGGLGAFAASAGTRPRGVGGMGPGARVFHATFGEGVVEAADGAGPNARLTIRFPSEPTPKKVVARFVRSVEES